ncbi:hypothetical protein Fbal_1629 [Ferrimonas balearica DSM 9799]|uniref:Uncharacterized protein n=1 Tax=Ferrimonas balearica (strain DSM 9799 / CCM 4581 / KCTC 23876 / PAT) TaxID=550540 RepID=E1SQN5_FERBD|nr:hypothetical protein Fbal_1629 [Ferrimonas balearica DSM 9799]
MVVFSSFAQGLGSIGVTLCDNGSLSKRIDP